MKISVPAKILTGSRETDQALDSIREALRIAFRSEDLSGVRVEKVSIGTSPQVISHGLGRQPVGWRVTDKQGPGDVYRVSWNAQRLTLQSSATVTCDLWVY